MLHRLVSSLSIWSRWTIVSLVLYILLVAFVVPFMIGIPHEIIFAGDAVAYSKAAFHLLQNYFYSADGTTAFVEREPMMSFFLAIVYMFFGYENAVAFVVTQSALLFVAALLFCGQLRRLYSARIAGIFLILLLTSGTVLHSVFSAYRECFLLIVLLLFSTLFLSNQQHRTTWKIVLLGLILGGIILNNFMFVFFPIALFLLCFSRFLFKEKQQSFRFRDASAIALIAYSIVSLWAYRNYSYDGHFRVISDFRTSIMWYVRGEQAENLHGMEPIRCLWSEYISRNWNGRSSACSVTGLFHQKWPEGVPRGDEKEIVSIAHRKILQHPVGYFWNSVVEILELHIPYVGGGWSFTFNLYTSLTGFLMYLGCFFGLPTLFKRKAELFLLLITYSVSIFILTDATPRYFVPTIFCYMVIAASGYDKIWRWMKSFFV